MKKKLSALSEYFKIEKLKNDQRVIVFLVCLLIATALWFLNAFAKDYSTTLAYPVKYINPPKNQFLSNNPPSKLDLKVNAHGFTLLRHKLSLSFSPIVLNLSNITRDVELTNGEYRVNSSSLSRRISDQVSSEITITGIEPEILHIKLDSLKSKIIPVVEKVELDFKPQFNLKGSVVIDPMQVQIKGPAAILDTTDFLFTEEISFNKVEADIEKKLRIVHPEKTTVDPKEVTLKISVEKFTEKEIVVPVHVKNKPDSVKIKLFPSEIKLTVMVGLSEFENIGSNSFDVYTDFTTIDSESDNIDVIVAPINSRLQVVRFTPERVEYLIETN